MPAYWVLHPWALALECNAYVPPGVPNYEAKTDLLRVWDFVRATDVLDGILISRSSRPIVSEPYHLWLESLPGHPPMYSNRWYFFTRVRLHTLYRGRSSLPSPCTMRPTSTATIFSRKILPIAELAFQVVLAFRFVAFALICCGMFHTVILLDLSHRPLCFPLTQIITSTSRAHPLASCTLPHAFLLHVVPGVCVISWMGLVPYDGICSLSSVGVPSGSQSCQGR